MTASPLSFPSFPNDLLSSQASSSSAPVSLTRDQRYLAKRELGRIDRFLQRRDYESKHYSEVAVDKNYKLMVDTIGKSCRISVLPDEVVVRHGCHGCEWRGTSQCAFGFRVSRGVRSEEYHANGICQLRYVWLLSLYDGDSETPSYRDWVRDFNRHAGQNQLIKNMRRITLIDEELARQRDAHTPEDELAPLVFARSQAHNEMLNFWKEIRKNEQKDDERTTARKIEMDVTHRNIMGIEDIHRIMRQGHKVVDAEVKPDEKA